MLGVPLSHTDILAKYSPAGELLWALDVPGRGYKVGFDREGNVIWTGSFSGVIAIDGIPHISEGWDDIFLASVTPDGSVNWSFAIGGVEPDIPTALTIGPGGDIYLSGRTKLSVDFDPGPGTMILDGEGLTDGFIARYTPQGALVWAKLVSTYGDEEIGFIEIDDDGMLYAVGTHRLPFDFSFGAGGGMISPVGNPGHFIAAYDTAGTFHWVRQFSGVGNSSVLHTAVGNNWDGGTAVVITGNFLDTLYLGTTSTYDGQGPVDAYTLVYDAAGNLLNSFTLGGDGAFLFAGDMVVQGNELLYSGSASGSIDLDPRAGFQSMFTASAEKDVFLVRYSNLWEPLEILTWEGNGEEYAQHLWQDAGANLLLGVRFDNTFYQKPLSNDDLASTNGDIDFSIIKLGNNVINVGLEYAELMPFTIYPVPASSSFQVRVSGMTSDASLLVYDVQGRVVYESILASGENEKTVVTQTWPGGMYTVAIGTANGIGTRKLMVLH
jgi:hypothetical protein